MTTRLLRRALACSLTLAASPALAQNVFVVDSGSEGDFTTIQEGVQSVPAGSILLVRPGLYQGSILVNAKPLTIVAWPGATIDFLGEIDVRNLAAGDAFVLSGFEVDSFGNSNETLRIVDNAGTVWIEDVSVTGGFPNLFTSADTVIVTDSASVVFAGCSFFGGVPAFEAPGGAALRATGSTIHAFDCTLTGGDGAASMFPQTGGPGVRQTDGLFFAAESTITGGDGSPGGNFFGCADGGPGGTGLVLLGTSPSAFLVNTTLAGGAGGLPVGPGTCNPGADGVPTAVPPGALTELSGPTHAFAAQSPVQTGESAQLDFVGAPGDFAWYLFGEETATLFLPVLAGSLTLDFPLFAIPVGTLGPSGTATVNATAPALPPSAQGADFFLQSLYFDGASFTLSEPAVLVVVQ